MKILWFEVTSPPTYKNDGRHRGGWQSSLEDIVKDIVDIELYVAFESKNDTEIKQIDGITYIPINIKFSKLQKFKSLLKPSLYIDRLLKECLKVVNHIHPDIIQVFGTEWPYGLLAKHTNIPVVAHIQGSIISYNYSDYPKRFSVPSQIRYYFPNLKKLLSIYLREKNKKRREKMEKEIWNIVRFFMGRTIWDKSMCNTLTKNCKYFLVNEAIRPEIIESDYKWNKANNNSRLIIVTTGNGEFRKGTDLILDTAHILKSNNIDFEWHIIGNYTSDYIKFIEKRLKKSFFDNNVILEGTLSADKVFNLLSRADIYVHTAYAENSPNSICEAQLLGIPVIAANVGGIRTLVRDQIDGILVPPSDPWQLANAIILLATDKEKMSIMSDNTYKNSHVRHDVNNIKKQLLEAYENIIKETTHK